MKIIELKIYNKRKKKACQMGLIVEWQLSGTDLSRSRETTDWWERTDKWI